MNIFDFLIGVVFASTASLVIIACRKAIATAILAALLAALLIHIMRG